MYVITVIPIAKGIGRETLTYFSGEAPAKGCLVEIPLRSKSAYGIVIGVEKAENKKSEIKTLRFNLKKIEHIQSKPFLTAEFIDGVHMIADYYATTTGAVLSNLIPKIILESIDTVTSAEEVPTQKVHSTKNVLGEITALQANDDERYGAYKSLIREEFARKNSVYICLPSREEIKMAMKTLHKGIEQYTYVLHNGLSKKELIAVWKNILENPHPILIIATGYFLSIPRRDVHAVIVENESSRAYTIPKRPFIDMRMAVEILSKKMNWKVILGDTALRVDTIYRERENEISEFSTLMFRVLTTAETALIDMRTPKNQTKKEFEMIGGELGKLIVKNKQNNANMFLFCARRGLSPLTVCADCGDTVSCENCGSPVVLYGKNDEKNKASNFFLCHVCGKKRPADILCVRCKSWKLTPLGVGIESVARELKKKFPEATVFLMDKDTIRTHVQAEKLIKKFYDTPGSILLGTEMALPYLKERIGTTAVVSLDAFFSLPDFRIKEKIMSIILHMRALAEKTILVQTRRPNETVFDYAPKGNLADFYREEIDERKKLGLPPINTFIKISLEGVKADVRAKMEKLQNDLRPFQLNIFEAFHARTGAKYMVHGLIMMPRTEWPQPDLVAKLRALPPQFLIKVDPDSLL
jgi:primosomal protein N'